MLSFVAVLTLAGLSWRWMESPLIARARANYSY
jgi:hypothetical protein